jgi:hypothetical protein
MLTLANLHRAVQATLAGKRLGKPVFVRYLMQGQDKAEGILAKLSLATAVIQEWLGQPLTRIYAVGTVDSGQVTLTLQFRDGASALVSFARGQVRGAGVDLMVLGNHGAVYLDAGSADLWDESAAVPADRPDPKIQAAIERALRSGKPEPAVVGDKP